MIVTKKQIELGQIVLYVSIVNETMMVEKKVVASIHDDKVGLISDIGTMDLRIVDRQFIATSTAEATALLRSMYEKLTREIEKRYKDIKSIESVRSSVFFLLEEVKGWEYEYASLEDIPACYIHG